MTTSNRFSIKCDVYTSPESRRTKSLDGPWKPTVQEAIRALADSLRKKGMADLSLIRPFVAERVPEAAAPSRDTRGICYRTFPITGLSGLLTDQGLEVF